MRAPLAFQDFIEICTRTAKPPTVNHKHSVSRNEGMATPVAIARRFDYLPEFHLVTASAKRQSPGMRLQLLRKMLIQLNHPAAASR